MNTWLAAAFWGLAPEPAVPVYALGGLSYAVLAGLYLRRVDARAGGGAPAPGPRASAVRPTGRAPAEPEGAAP